MISRVISNSWCISDALSLSAINVELDSVGAMGLGKLLHGVFLLSVLSVECCRVA